MVFFLKFFFLFINIITVSLLYFEHLLNPDTPGVHLHRCSEYTMPAVNLKHEQSLDYVWL